MKNKNLLIIICVVVVIAIIICVTSVMKKNKLTDQNVTANNNTQTDSSQEYKEIKKFECNQFTQASISQIDLASGYLKDFVNNVLFNPKAAYESLKQEYKEKRFNNSYEKFVEYIQYVGLEWTTIELDKYRVSEDGKQFVCIDNKGTQYIFDVVRGVMEYEVTIDTYTLTENEYFAKYEKANEQKKVVMNIDKIINMINNKDYEKLYAKLEDNFRQTYFPEIKDYVEYLQNEFYMYNEENYGSYVKQGDVHVYNITISDITKEITLERDLTVMMKLLDNNDFVYTIPFNY